MELPVIMNINPRSIYNKTDEFSLLIDQYQADVICMSESWERDNLSLEELLNLDGYRILSNVKQRDFKGGKPAILVNEEKYFVKPLCPEPITVPVGVECVWALITPKHISPQSRVKYIAVAAIYYRGPKSTQKDELFDHIAESFHFLSSKYGSSIHFVIAGDTNRLNLSPITNLSPNLKQEVKVPTRLNPPAILDPIISTLGRWYQSPVTKPPIRPNDGQGKPSDHLTVLWLPLVSTLQIPPRKYTTVVTRPLTRSGIEKFAEWVENCTWSEIYDCKDGHKKAQMFQDILMSNYHRCFPTKQLKVCAEDKPWFSVELKKLNRKMKREFLKHKDSPKWSSMNEEYQERCEQEKQSYYDNLVSDLKTSNPGKWYSQLKRMSGQANSKQTNILVDELIGLNDQEQAERIADHYSTISNQYEQVKSDDFKEYFKDTKDGNAVPNVEPLKVHQIIQTMNQKAATVQGDIPIKLITEFSVELAFPLAHIIRFCLSNGVYPDLWKLEMVSPAPKVFPPEKLKDLRKISGLLNFAKITDKILGEFMINDMAASRDLAQYGNEKKLSAQHYLIKMLNRILTAVDSNSQSEAMAVIVSMIDWSQAFDRQSHHLGIQSFIDNGVRGSLIPILISFFQNRKMIVKWNGTTSSAHTLNGGGPQGDLLGILEYLAQTNKNTDFLSEKDKFKFIDDLSFLEMINLISQGISSFNFKAHVASDIGSHNQFLPAENVNTQGYLNKISDWTDANLMKLNTDKSKYMLVNFTDNFQFSTRLALKDDLMEQVKKTRLLGVVVNDELTWKSNTDFLVKKAYKRMTMLHKLYEFQLPVEEMVQIYILYIRSLLESSAVVWHSSLTNGEVVEFERVQKVALRIILDNDYETYSQALELTNLQTLDERRTLLCKKFALNCAKNPKTSAMFPLNSSHLNTRHHEKYFVQPARTDRLKDSAIPYMQRLLNQ